MNQKLSYAKRLDAQAAAGSRGPTSPRNRVPMLPPTRAWSILCARTGGSIALVTFYRWLRNGKIYSIRLGQRIFVPQTALDDAIKQCLAGERF